MITKQQISDAADALDMISHYAGISDEGLRLAKSALERVGADCAPGVAAAMGDASDNEGKTYFTWHNEHGARVKSTVPREVLEQVFKDAKFQEVVWSCPESSIDVEVEPIEPGHVDFTAGISAPTVEMAWRDWANAEIVHRVRVSADFCKTVIENGLSYRVKTPDLKHISPEALAFGAEVAESARLEGVTKRILDDIRNGTAPVEHISFKGVKVQSISTRVQILNEAAKLTSGDRDASYGDPKVNLSCAGELKQLAREWLAQGVRGALEPGEMEAIDQVLTKVARVLTGAYKRDNYVDGACYFAIAGECGEPTPTMVDLDLKCGDEASPAVQAAYERLKDIASRVGKVEAELDEAHDDAMTRVKGLAEEAQRESAKRAAAGDTAPWKEEREAPKPDLSSLFAFAPRYHTGGRLDLMPGEIPAILSGCGCHSGLAPRLADAIAQDVMRTGGAVITLKRGTKRSEAELTLDALFGSSDVYTD